MEEPKMLVRRREHSLVHRRRSEDTRMPVEPGNER